MLRFGYGRGFAIFGVTEFARVLLCGPSLGPGFRTYVVGSCGGCREPLSCFPLLSGSDGRVLGLAVNSGFVRVSDVDHSVLGCWVRLPVGLW